MNKESINGDKSLSRSEWENLTKYSVMHKAEEDFINQFYKKIKSTL